MFTTLSPKRSASNPPSIGVGPSVGHGERTSPSMLEDKIFVIEFGAVDRFAAGSVVPGDI